MKDVRLFKAMVEADGEVGEGVGHDESIAMSNSSYLVLYQIRLRDAVRQQHMAAMPGANAPRYAVVMTRNGSDSCDEQRIVDYCNEVHSQPPNYVRCPLVDRNLICFIPQTTIHEQETRTRQYIVTATLAIKPGEFLIGSGKGATFNLAKRVASRELWTKLSKMNKMAFSATHRTHKTSELA